MAQGQFWDLQRLNTIIDRVDKGERFDALESMPSTKLQLLRVVFEHGNECGVSDFTYVMSDTFLQIVARNNAIHADSKTIHYVSSKVRLIQVLGGPDAYLKRLEDNLDQYKAVRQLGPDRSLDSPNRGGRGLNNNKKPPRPSARASKPSKKAEF